MRPDVAKFLHDVLKACSLVEQFTDGKSLADYQTDALLRAGVEREFIIIGEALIQSEKLDPASLTSITQLRKIVGFRHVLVHGYGVVQDETVWGVVERRLPTLKREVAALLSGPTNPPS